MKKKVKDYSLYFIGFILIALSIAMHNHHGLGNNPLDNLYLGLAKAMKLSVGYTTIIFNAIILVLYFLINRNKDIFISIIGLLFLGNFINLFSSILVYDNAHMAIRILEFVLATNFGVIGVILILRTKLSMLALECLVTMVRKIKPLRNLSFGGGRIVVDIICAILALLVEFLTTGQIALVGYTTTVILILISGPLIDLYQKLIDKWSKKKNDEELQA